MEAWKIRVWSSSAIPTIWTYTGYNKKDAQLCLATSKRPYSLGAERVISSCLQGKWTCSLDEVWGNRAGKKSAEHIGCIFWGQAAITTIRWG